MIKVVALTQTYLIEEIFLSLPRVKLYKQLENSSFSLLIKEISNEKKSLTVFVFLKKAFKIWCKQLTTYLHDKTFAPQH